MTILPAEMPAVDVSIGRIVSVTGAKAILLLDLGTNGPRARPEMGTLLGIDTANTVVLAIVSALSVPVPAQRDGDPEVWIAELGLVGEIVKDPATGKIKSFNRGVTLYPSLGDRVRIATQPELQMAFCGDDQTSVRVGAIRQDSTIPAMVKVDDLLGKHFAILGTTGTGKSCTTALILRSILNKNPAAHIVLLDPHNEYATAFGDWGEVINPRNMQLPFWLLNFEELVEVLIGDPERKAEIEILQELIPIAKSRYSTGRGKESQAVRRTAIDSGRYTVDTPVPYRISDLTALIDERMGKLENKRDLAPYRQVKLRIESISQDARYSFMFGSLTVYDGMAQVLSRIFRVPVNGRPITIIELTGIPSEIVAVVVSVVCRMTFDFALWSEGKVPVTVVCEEAHRYVPANSNNCFEPAKRAIAKIAKEGRKYGASLCIVTQRPAEIDPTILSQCNTVFALRMSNDRDQAIVSSAISDTGSGLLEFLSALGQREAIAFGDGVSLPVRIRFDEMPKQYLPRSSGAAFTKQWQHSENDEQFLDQLVERWRSAGLGGHLDAAQQAAQLADAMAPSHHGFEEPASQLVHAGVSQPAAAPPLALRPSSQVARPAAAVATAAQPAYAAAVPAASASAPGVQPMSAGGLLRRQLGSAPAPTPAPAAPAGPAASSAARSLRDRLMSRG